MPDKTITIPRRLTRAAEITREGDALMVSISSDVPYRRSDWTPDGWQDYYEVLDHSPGGLDDERLKTPGLPILFNHNRDDNLANARAFKNDGHKISLPVADFIWASGQLAENKRKDMESGALPHTSVGYQLTGDGICIGARDEIPVYKFPWKIWEGSVVTVPADATVGVGKSQRHVGESEDMVTISIRSKEEIDTPPIPNKTTTNPPTKPMKLTSLARQHFLAPDGDNATGGGQQAPAVDVAKERSDAVKEHKAKCKKIDEFVAAVKNPAWQKKAGEIAIKHKDDGADFDAFRSEALNHFTSDTVIDEPQRSEGRIQVIGERGQNPNLRAMTPGAKFTSGKGFQTFVKGEGRGAYREELGDSILSRSLMTRGQQRAGFNSSDLSAINLTISQELISLGVQRLTIMDLLAGGTMSTAGFIYPVENSFDPFAVAAGTVGERGLKPEWEPDITTARADAQVIAVMATVPKQFMQDFAAFGSWLDNRGDYLLQIKAEQQLLYGDGIGSNIKGLMTFAGVQTRAYGTVGSETTPDALFRGNTDIETNAYFDVDGFAMHPHDFEQIRLLKDANGQYLGGGPFYAPYGTGAFLKYHTVWGLPCVVTKSVFQGRPIAGAWKMGAQWFLRSGLEIETSTSHKDYFQRNLLAVLFEERMALAVYRPIAFLEHTGFPGRS